MSELGVYLGKREYVVWLTHQGPAYATEKDLWVAADAVLPAAIEDYSKDGTPISDQLKHLPAEERRSM